MFLGWRLLPTFGEVRFEISTDIVGHKCVRNAIGTRMNAVSGSKIAVRRARCGCMQGDAQLALPHGLPSEYPIARPVRLLAGRCPACRAMGMTSGMQGDAQLALAEKS